LLSSFPSRTCFANSPFPAFAFASSIHIRQPPRTPGKKQQKRAHGIHVASAAQKWQWTYGRPRNGVASEVT
jgi:hypothetical protein